MAVTAQKAAKKRRKKGINPWVPNQHGAWAMLIAPAVLGLIGALFSLNDDSWRPVLALPAIMVAWFFGYFAFFAFGLVAKARTPKRKKQYLPPVLTYGAVSLIAIVVAMVAQPQLIWWALFFGPLVAVAVWETLRGRARSLVSGVSTTIASALLVPALVMAGQGVALAEVPVSAWGSAAFLAIYFAGTIPMVKTMIRERGNMNYFYGSVAYHVVALLAVVVLVWFGRVGAVATLFMILTMIVALFRAWWLPASARKDRSWSARQVGMAEVPILLVASTGVLAVLM